jgi:DNA-binding CsgD family transcriptional regulator
VLLLDGEMHILFKNQEAERALADGLSLEALARSQQTGRNLAIDPDLSSGGSFPGSPKVVQAFRVDRDDGKPFLLYILPVTSETSISTLTMFGKVRTIVLIIDSARQAVLDPTMLRDIFGLTLAEARVAALVGAGTTPINAAQILGVAEDTVRKALKSVFSKTGVGRQAELVLLLSRMALH